jgi:hypothetical protein
MSLRSENYPYVFFQGKVTTFQPSTKFRFTFFGGPSDLRTEGVAIGPRALHQVLTLHTRDLGPSAVKLETDLTFKYGLAYDGCYLEYKTLYRAIEIVKMEPSKSSDDWPYADYPVLLPYVPLEIKEARECSLKEFSDSVMQGIDKTHDAEVIVIVPPNPELRMSIWGPSGDANDVQIIFRYDATTGITKVYNACT